MNGILGKKIGMTQVFSGDGSIIPVTVIESSYCSVLQIKTKDKDGYNAIQLGLKKAKAAKKKKNVKFIKEITVADPQN